MPFCNKCGTEVPENINFCAKCGNAMQSGQKPVQTNSLQKPSDAFAWALALTPVIGYISEIILVFAGVDNAESISNFGMVGMTFGFADLDKKELRKKGVNVGKWWWWWLFYPVYLFLRAGKTSKKYGYAITNCVLIALFILLDLLATDEFKEKIEEWRSDDEVLFENIESEDLSASMNEKKAEKPRKKQGGGGKPRGKGNTLYDEREAKPIPMKEQTGYLADARDGKTYKTIKIGTQTWMAENLNYNASGSVCYDNDPANCQKYGRLYDWNTAMKACPSGWHLPVNAEWDRLYRHVDGTSGTDNPYESPDAGKHLKAESGWNDFNGKSGNGLDTYGFAALPGGSLAGKFHLAGDNGYWWSASESGDGNGYYRFMLGESERAGWNEKTNTKYMSFNVRCVKN